jgi:conjugal transfer pilus assembly protein TraB
LQRQELEESLRQSNLVVTNEASRIDVTSKSLGAFSKEYNTKKKNIKSYVTSGSFARAVLLTGVVVGTGTNTQSNPEPVMMRLTDASIFSKGKRTEQIKEAILIGDCSGDLSSERAKCRLQTLSLENFKGEIVERPIQGWIVGEDGRNGIKGMVVDKSSDMLRMAMLNGVLGGMSNFLQNQSTKGIFPISPESGQQ